MGGGGYFFFVFFFHFNLPGGGGPKKKPPGGIIYFFPYWGFFGFFPFRGPPPPQNNPGVLGFTEHYSGAETHCALRIIFPLSNPSRSRRPHHRKLLYGLEGELLLPQAGPLNQFQYAGKTMLLRQCNNSYIFRGIGLGVHCRKLAMVSD